MMTPYHFSSPHPPDRETQESTSVPRNRAAPQQVRLSGTVQRSQRQHPRRWHLVFPHYRWPRWSGYVAAVLGVALTTGAISLISQAVHLSNISLLYLFVILWLATAFGRGPALVASVVAFLS